MQSMLLFKNRVCPRWLNGKTCPFPAEKCFFKHTKDFMPLCQNWVEGKCIGGHGNSCSSRHYYMETDKNQNNQADTVKPAESVLTQFQFSSPLVQRNIKETKRLRRIHVDIETKCETSFTEEITEVIVDLTGQPPTPVRPAAQFIKKNLENIDPKDLAKEADSNKAFDIEELKENDNEEESNDNNNTTEVKEGECRYCVKMFKGMRGLRSHLTRNKVCGKKWKLDTRKSKIQNVEKSNSSISSNSSDLHTTASSTMMRESTIGSLLDSPSVESSSAMMRESTIGSLLDSPSVESSSAGSSLRNNQMLTSTPAPSKPDNSKSKERSCSTISNETTHTPTTTSRKRNSTLEVSLVHPSTKDSDNIRENQSVIEIIDDSEINGSTIIID